MRDFFAMYALLVLCAEVAVAQFIGQQQTAFQQPFNDFRQGAVSSQQQAHILSDIQHRFHQPANVQQQYQQFPTQQNQFQQYPQSQFRQQSPLQSQPAVPAQNPVQQGANRHVHIQHHTQTSFKPNFQDAQQPAPQNQLQSVRTTDLPTIRETIFSGNTPFPHSQSQDQQLDPEKQKQRLKELKEKQAIIDKHNQFVERQYEKALKKAQQDHDDFIETQSNHKKKLYQSLYKNRDAYDSIQFPQTNPRYLYPEETELFQRAVKKYYEEHPTTPTTTTTTTTTTETPATTTTGSKTTENSDPDPELYPSATNSKFFSQINSQRGPSDAQIQKIQFLPTAVPTRKIHSLDDLTELKKQYKNQQIKKDDLLAQLRLAISENSQDDLSKNLTSREIALPNGQRVQIIHTSDPKAITGSRHLNLNSGDFTQLVVPTTTGKPAKAILEELTKSVIPPGADFELLKQGHSGLEQVGGLPQNLPNQKKVTFVLLEEQNDGSFKVQGVKGNGKEKSEVDVDSILKKIKDGEIKLPPNTKIRKDGPEATSESTIESTITTVDDVGDADEAEITVLPNAVPLNAVSSTPVSIHDIGPHFAASTTPIPTTIYTNTHTTSPRSIDSHPVPKKIQDFEPLRFSPSGSVVKQTTSANIPSFNSLFMQSKPTGPPIYSSFQTPNSGSVFQTVSLPQSTLQAPLNYDEASLDLLEVLKRSGLFAMARFLRQSGLDTILNETGPYTVFAPTDKAFRTLLVQLGGPEKAEDKFKENPRLLSGLLLHHVIPGSFKIESLQDEMTGVSLAGTQLRVNQYNMHDLEWNDIKITTINGAKIMEDKKDIEIPQGIAHSVDRVMFPLPVGDIVQTLQSDRERRFTSFLRALFASGLAETLQSTKTFTLFAPTDKAFMGLTSEELTRTVSDRVLARELIMKHLTPGTLYTNGMRYYQIRDSLEPNRQITLSKTSGRVKVNNNPIITQNIPATNGVIHALDNLL